MFGFLDIGLKFFLTRTRFAWSEAFVSRRNENLSRAYIFMLFPYETRHSNLIALESILLNQISLNWFESLLSLSLSLFTQESPVQVNLFKCRSIEKDDTHRHGGSTHFCLSFFPPLSSALRSFCKPASEGAAGTMTLMARFENLFINDGARRLSRISADEIRPRDKFSRAENRIRTNFP